MNRKVRALSGAAAVSLVLGLATAASAQQPQDPGTGGQLNGCWGQVASGIAQLGGDDDIPGGGMGSHSRSTTAANNNGGFASDDNFFRITFNEENDDGNHGREGVGNVSRSAHSTHPGDGGNGQHAINNSNDGGLSNILDPVDGSFPSSGDQGLGCDLVP